MDCNQLNLIAGYATFPLLGGVACFVPALIMQLYTAHKLKSNLMDVIIAPFPIILGVITAVALFGVYVLIVLCALKYELAALIYLIFLVACIILFFAYSELNFPWNFVYTKFINLPSTLA